MKLEQVKRIREMLNFKKCIICLLLLILCGTIYSVIETYGLYEGSKDGEVEANTASFALIINDSTIDNSNTTFDIDALTITNNIHTKNGKLAPGSEGYFDIVLDPESVDVAVKYDITLDLSDLNTSVQMKSIVDANRGANLIRTGEFTYSGIVPIVDVVANTSNTVRITMEWLNVAGNDEVDTALSTGEDLEIPVTILLTQYLGETLVPYVSEEE